MKYWAYFLWPISDFRFPLNLKAHISGSLCSPCGGCTYVQEVGAKFSPTWEVEEELDLLIREGVLPLGK